MLQDSLPQDINATGAVDIAAGAIDISVNGEIRRITLPATVGTLLDQMQLTGKRLAVERNGDIVSKSRHAETQLVAGDRLEIVVAVGGG